MPWTDIDYGGRRVRVPPLRACTRYRRKRGYVLEHSYEGVFDFYVDRINACRNYGLKAGDEILHVITRTAFRDSMLTDSEFNSIMILAEKAHIKMMEDNYNAGWNE